MCVCVCVCVALCVTGMVAFVRLVIVVAAAAELLHKSCARLPLSVFILFSSRVCLFVMTTDASSHLNVKMLRMHLGSSGFFYFCFAPLRQCRWKFG